MRVSGDESDEGNEVSCFVLRDFDGCCAGHHSRSIGPVSALLQSTAEVCAEKERLTLGLRHFSDVTCFFLRLDMCREEAFLRTGFGTRSRNPKT